MRGVRAAAFAMIVFVVGLAGKAIADGAVSLDAVLAKLAPLPADQSLTRIPDPGRKLLALRSYTGYGAKIGER